MCVFVCVGVRVCVCARVCVGPEPATECATALAEIEQGTELAPGRTTEPATHWKMR